METRAEQRLPTPQEAIDIGKSIPNMSASIDSPLSRDTTSSRRQTCPKTIVAVARESFKCTEEEASIFFFLKVSS